MHGEGEHPNGDAKAYPCEGADREPPYYPAFHEFNPQSAATRPRSRRLILFPLDPAVFPDLDYTRLKRSFDYLVEY